EMVCDIRKPRETRPGCARRKAHRIPTIRKKARTNPTTGEVTIGRMTFSQTPFHSTVMPAARPAPIMPPISACEEDEGSPKYQVATFHTIAPTSSEKTTHSPASPLRVLMIPLVMVEATPPP